MTFLQSIKKLLEVQTIAKKLKVTTKTASYLISGQYAKSTRGKQRSDTRESIIVDDLRRMIAEYDERKAREDR